MPAQPCSGCICLLLVQAHALNSVCCCHCGCQQRTACPDAVALRQPPHHFHQHLCGSCYKVLLPLAVLGGIAPVRLLLLQPEHCLPGSSSNKAGRCHALNISDTAYE
jgi:hypothetical protein